MRLVNPSPRYALWAGVLLGLFLTSLPLVAIAVEFKPPQRGIPGRREGGGTRDLLVCVTGTPGRLTALMPQTNVGWTSSDHPRFFWYVPQTRAKTAEFVLFQVNDQLEDQATVYRTMVPVPTTPGIASLPLPAGTPALETGKTYRWALALVCDTERRERDILVEGWVERINPAPALTSQLEKASDRDRLKLYASNGFWFETLNTLATLRCANPNDAGLTAEWADLMKSVKLGAIADQPLLQPCKK